MKTNKALIAIICVMAAVIVSLVGVIIFLNSKPDVGKSTMVGIMTGIKSKIPEISSVIKSDDVGTNFTTTNRPAIEQLSDDEYTFYEDLLSVVIFFNVPSSVRVVRIQSFDSDSGEYLVLLSANNVLGTKLSGQYVLAYNKIEETTETIQYNDPRFNIELMNQAIEEYWGLGDSSLVGSGHRETANSNTSNKSAYWKTDYYVDEFQRPTLETYITNKDLIWGQFSNSAVTGKELAVKIVIDKDNVGIALYEYGSSMVKNYSTLEPTKYTITMQSVDGTKYDITGKMNCGSDRVIVDSKYRDVVLEALKEDGTISFFLVDDNIVISTYLFEVESINFAEIFESMFQSIEADNMNSTSASWQDEVRGSVYHKRGNAFCVAL